MKPNSIFLVVFTLLTSLSADLWSAAGFYFTPDRPGQNQSVPNQSRRNSIVAKAVAALFSPNFKGKNGVDPSTRRTQFMRQQLDCACRGLQQVDSKRLLADLEALCSNNNITMQSDGKGRECRLQITFTDNTKKTELSFSPNQGMEENFDCIIEQIEQRDHQAHSFQKNMAAAYKELETQLGAAATYFNNRKNTKNLYDCQLYARALAAYLLQAAYERREARLLAEQERQKKAAEEKAKDSIVQDNDKSEELSESIEPVVFAGVDDVVVEPQGDQQNALDESIELVEESPTREDLLKSPILARSVVVLSAPSIPVEVNEHVVAAVSAPKRNVAPKNNIPVTPQPQPIVAQEESPVRVEQQPTPDAVVPQPAPIVVPKKVVTPESPEKNNAAEAAAKITSAKQQRNNAIIKRLASVGVLAAAAWLCKKNSPQIKRFVQQSVIKIFSYRSANNKLPVVATVLQAGPVKAVERLSWWRFWWNKVRQALFSAPQKLSR